MASYISTPNNKCFKRIVLLNKYLDMLSYDEKQTFLKLRRQTTSFESAFEFFIKNSSTEDRIKQHLVNYISEAYPKIHYYIEQLGIDKIKQYSFQTGKLNQLLSAQVTKFDNAKQITIELSEKLKSIDRIAPKELKTIMQEIYKKYNINATAKATSIKEFGFKIERLSVRDKNQKSIMVYKIINRPTVNRIKINNG
jgi:hypothetical protein